MSPLLKAIGIGVAVAAGSLLLMWGIARLLNRPFLASPPRPPPPTPTIPPFPTLIRPPGPRAVP